MIPETVFDDRGRRLRFQRMVVGHHEPSVARLPFGSTTVFASHDPRRAFAATEVAAGRAPRSGPRWFSARPDQSNYWALWSLLMLGFVGYCIDNAEWYGVVLFSIFTVTSLIAMTSALLVRNDVAWQVRSEVAAIRNQPMRSAFLAAALIRDHGDNAEALAGVAAWAYANDRWPDSEAAYTRYLALIPDDPFAMLRLIDVQLHCGKGNDAVASIARAHGLDGIDATRDLLMRRQAAELCAGRPAAALALAPSLPEEGALPAGDADFVRYLRALALAASDSGAASKELAALATAHPTHERFSRLRDALAAGDYRLSLADIVECERLSESPLLSRPQADLSLAPSD